MSTVIQLLEEKIAVHKQAIEQLESAIAAIRGKQPRAKVTAPAKKAATKAKAAPAKKSMAQAKAAAPKGAKAGKQQRPVSYVAMAEELLAKVGQPMRMSELVNSLLSKRPDAGKYAASAARQAITAAAEKPNSRIVRLGEKGSGMYGLRDWQ